MDKYDNCIFNALAHIAACAEALREAERLQSEMDPIRGPGSREWEILAERLETLEGDLRLANDEPGALEVAVDDAALPPGALDVAGDSVLPPGNDPNAITIVGTLGSLTGPYRIVHTFSEDGGNELYVIRYDGKNTDPGNMLVAEPSGELHLTYWICGEEFVFDGYENGRRVLRLVEPE